MGIFAYTALDPAGRTMTGTIPADTRAQAMDHVISRGLSPIKVDEQKTAQQLMKKSTSLGGSRESSGDAHVTHRHARCEDQLFQHIGCRYADTGQIRRLMEGSRLVQITEAMRQWLGPSALTRTPSVQMSATSTPSSEVPLISPSAVTAVTSVLTSSKLS